MDLLALGEPLLEFNDAEGRGLRSTRSFSVGYGGDTSNAAVAAARAGASVGMVTRVGADDFGDAFFDLWNREGVDTGGVIREEGGRTGVYFVARDPDNSGFSYYRADSPASRLAPADIDDNAVARARALHVSGITLAISRSARDAALHAMKVAHENGTLVSYDPNHRPSLWSISDAQQALEDVLPLADVVLPNLEEARLLTGREFPEEIANWLAERGPRTVVIKLGADGALLHHHGATAHVHGHQVAALDSTGAGDAFDGSFLAEVLRGADHVVAARYAAIAGALTTLGWGAVDPIPQRSVVTGVLASEQPEQHFDSEAHA